MLSVSGRHNDDRLRNASGVSGRHPKLIIISDLYRSLPTSHGDCRIALYPCNIKAFNIFFSGYYERKYIILLRKYLGTCNYDINTVPVVIQLQNINSRREKGKTNAKKMEFLKRKRFHDF